MVGSAARIRASSFTFPVFLSNGTLKSTRMNSRLPAIGSCSMDRIIAALELAGDEETHVHHAVRKTPLVVVPGEHLDELAVVSDRGLGGVEDRGSRIAVVIDAHGLLGVVLEHSLELPFGGGLERCVDPFD